MPAGPRKGSTRRSRLDIALWLSIVGGAVVADGCAGRVRPSTPSVGGLSAGAPFTATAYCTGSVTATGAAPSEKTVAADPAVLPLGSRIRLSGLDKRYNRVYVVMDTGPSIRGRRIDLFVRDCREAVTFG